MTIPSNTPLPSPRCVMLYGKTFDDLIDRGLIAVRQCAVGLEEHMRCLETH